MNRTRGSLDELNCEFLRNLDQSLADLDIPQPVAPTARPTWKRRSRGAARVSENQAILRVSQYDGVLVLEEGIRPPRAGLRRRRRGAVPGGTLLREIEYQRLGRNDISWALQKIDGQLTKNQGLRQWREGMLTRRMRLRKTGRILLFIHGTFSNNDKLLGGLKKTDKGRDLLARLERHYDQILAFDHPTLSESAVLNARQLERELRGSEAQIDVICHSRGGLVTRWWLEGFDWGDPATRRVLFLGSPLLGTSLASPSRLRAGLSFLANTNRVLAKVAGFGSAAVPLLNVAVGIFQVISSVTSFAARTPLLDAAVALVPGLQSMSRVENNRELDSLHRWQGQPNGRYFVVQSDFEPQGHGWKFWRNFHGLGGRIADLAADPLFAGSNDLVVDTDSMSDFRAGNPLPSRQLLDFQKNSRVHHLNYLEQEETLDFITTVFQIPI